jgi:hypothetical protein
MRSEKVGHCSPRRISPLVRVPEGRGVGAMVLISIAKRGADAKGNHSVRFLTESSSTDKANPKPQQRPLVSAVRTNELRKKPDQRLSTGKCIGLRWSLAEIAVLLQLPQKLPQSPKTQEANRFRLASKSFVFRLVRRRGLEPLCLAALAPQASASANFATSAFDSTLRA